MRLNRIAKATLLLVWLLLLAAAFAAGVRTACAAGLPKCMQCTCRNCLVRKLLPNGSQQGPQDAHGTPIPWGINSMWADTCPASPTLQQNGTAMLYNYTKVASSCDTTGVADGQAVRYVFTDSDGGTAVDGNQHNIFICVGP
jgi:hypothetical protein